MHYSIAPHHVRVGSEALSCVFFFVMYRWYSAVLVSRPALALQYLGDTLCSRVSSTYTVNRPGPQRLFGFSRSRQEFVPGENKTVFHGGGR